MLKPNFLWWIICISLIISSILSKFINTNNTLEADVKTAYCEYNRDVLDLVWCCLNYDKRRLAPLGTELILRPFDFRPENLSDYVYHSRLTKEMNDYLSENPKNDAVSVYIGKTKESWNVFTNAVEIYNQSVRKSNTLKARLYMLGFPVKYGSELNFEEKRPSKKI